MSCTKNCFVYAKSMRNARGCLCNRRSMVFLSRSHVLTVLGSGHVGGKCQVWEPRVWGFHELGCSGRSPNHEHPRFVAPRLDTYHQHGPTPGQSGHGPCLRRPGSCACTGSPHHSCGSQWYHRFSVTLLYFIPARPFADDLQAPARLYVTVQHACTLAVQIACLLVVTSVM